MKPRRPADKPLFDTVREFVRHRSLIQPNDGIVVAVSGGPDSLALLHLLTRLQAEWSLRLVAAHLHHGMRGQIADEDAAFVAATAQSWGVPAVIGGEDVPALAQTRRCGIEEAGRAARYGFLARVAAEQQCQRIATAHTADDRVETVILNLCRGTGIDGLAGIPACRPLTSAQLFPEVVRPLIDCWRCDVLAYSEAYGLEPRWDASNEAREHARNRVRNELLPWLERELSTAVRPHLLRLATLAEEESALLRELAQELFEKATVGATDSEMRLRRSVLAAAPPPLARRSLLAALSGLGGPTAGRNRTTIEALMAMARGELLTGIAVPETSITALIKGDVLVLRTSLPPAEPRAEVERVLCVPGSTDCPELSLRIDAYLRPAPVDLRRHPSIEAVLDWERLRPPLNVRTPRPGDRIVPLGMSGHRKLHDLFIDLKIPRAKRALVPVIADTERIVWVIGGCVSEEAKVRPETRQMVHLTASPSARQA
jgi:tRNA(Ile)-lysidine synthase